MGRMSEIVTNCVSDPQQLKVNFDVSPQKPLFMCADVPVSIACGDRSRPGGWGVVTEWAGIYTGETRGGIGNTRDLTLGRRRTQH